LRVFAVSAAAAAVSLSFRPLVTAGSVLKLATSCSSAAKVTGAELNSKVPAPTLYTS
jgi:hypothetical protein